MSIEVLSVLLSVRMDLYKSVHWTHTMYRLSVIILNRIVCFTLFVSPAYCVHLSFPLNLRSFLCLVPYCFRTFFLHLRTDVLAAKNFFRRLGVLNVAKHVDTCCQAIHYPTRYLLPRWVGGVCDFGFVFLCAVNVVPIALADKVLVHLVLLRWIICCGLDFCEGASFPGVLRSGTTVVDSG